MRRPGPSPGAVDRGATPLPTVLAVLLVLGGLGGLVGLTGCGSAGTASGPVPGSAGAVIDPPVPAQEPPPVLPLVDSACRSAGGQAPETLQACISGTDAYIWGYAPLALARLGAELTCLVGVDALLNATTPVGPGPAPVVPSTVDSLTSAAWLDLRGGPEVLTVPAVRGRYVDFQFLDSATNTFADVGVLTDGGRPGRYAVLGPGWQGSLPPGVIRLAAPSWDVLLLGRTAVTGPADLPAALAVERGARLDPLGPRGAPTTPPGSVPPCASSPATSPVPIDESGPPVFDELAAVLADDPPPAQDAPLEAVMAAGGIVSGSEPSRSADPAVLAGYREALGLGPQLMALGAGQARKVTTTGWTTGRAVGSYGTDYLARALSAQTELGSAPARQAVTFRAGAAETGGVLSGLHRYRLHFPPGRLPPTAPRVGQWSLSASDAQGHLPADPADPSGRTAIGSRTAGLRTNPDGSLDLYLATSPPPGHESNWLPVPPGSFSLVLRLSAPDGAAAPPAPPRWAPPAIELLDGPGY